MKRGRRVDYQSDTFIRALETGDLEALRAIPKGDLHVHGLCGGTRAAYEAWCGMRFPPPPEVFADFADFDHYLLVTLAKPYEALSGEERARFFNFFFENTLETAIADGVTLMEPSLDAFLVGLYGGDLERYMAAIQGVIDRVLARHPQSALVVRPELGMAKGVPLEYLEAWVPPAISSGFFSSIDLYGDERKGDDADYLPFYRLAKERGLRLKAHAGELRGPDAVRRAVALFDLDAVQHGISAAEDPALLDWLAARGTVLNICPTSNVRLGCVPSIAEHPIALIARAGVPVTVNSDDIVIFDHSTSGEYLALYRAGVLDARELDAIRVASLRQGR